MGYSIHPPFRPCISTSRTSYPRMTTHQSSTGATGGPGIKTHRSQLTVLMTTSMSLYVALITIFWVVVLKSITGCLLVTLSCCSKLSVHRQTPYLAMVHRSGGPDGQAHDRRWGWIYQRWSDGRNRFPFSPGRLEKGGLNLKCDPCRKSYASSAERLGWRTISVRNAYVQSCHVILTSRIY